MDLKEPETVLSDVTPGDEKALARLYGEPFFEIPRDLYIPANALQVFLDAFEGPLDLLLYLIRKQNFDIMDIPMAAVTRQYLAYVDEIRATNLELASEYLLIAAMLIEIKSRMLLPSKKLAEETEPDDPRAELARRLLEYERIKLAAAALNGLPRIGRDFETSHVHIEQAEEKSLPDVHVADLHAAWLGIVKRMHLAKKHVITREALSVRQHMSIVLRCLSDHKFLEFEQMFDVSEGMPVLVVTFIALLELTKEGLLDITQAEAYAPLYVRLAQKLV